MGFNDTRKKDWKRNLSVARETNMTKAIYGNKEKREPVLGPRPTFEKEYLKDAKTPEEIEEAIKKYAEVNKNFSEEIIRGWAKEYVKSRRFDEKDDDAR